MADKIFEQKMYGVVILNGRIIVLIRSCQGVGGVSWKDLYSLKVNS